MSYLLVEICGMSIAIVLVGNNVSWIELSRDDIIDPAKCKFESYSL